jgi:catechol 2,3-dioxygenase-like lactoylglutathione lyase family enzyme
MHIIELNHVAIHVANVEKSVAFYRDVLGLQPKERPAFDFPGAWFKLGNQELHLIGNRTDVVNSHSRGSHFALRVQNLKSLEDSLRAKEARFTNMQLRPDGVRQLFVMDPDGHYIEFCEM